MTQHPKSDVTTSNQHGSVRSYAIGFLLSLIFTIVPYYMVTRGVTGGTTLLVVVLGIAVLQMFVQIFFFLHLGRGPKPFYNVIFFFATAAMIVLVVGASILIMNNLYRNMSPQEATMRLAQEENIAEISGVPTGACQGNNANHTIVFSGSAVSPRHTEASRCDTLTIVIGDGIARTVDFGTPDTPKSYGGHDSTSVRADRHKIITLNEAGSFSLYDRDNHETTATFTVKP